MGARLGSACVHSFVCYCGRRRSRGLLGDANVSAHSSFVRSFVYYYVQYDCVSVVSLLFTHTFIYALHRRRRKKENRTDLPRLVRLWSLLVDLSDVCVCFDWVMALKGRGGGLLLPPTDDDALLCSGVVVVALNWYSGLIRLRVLIRVSSCTRRRRRRTKTKNCLGKRRRAGSFFNSQRDSESGQETRHNTSTSFFSIRGTAVSREGGRKNPDPPALLLPAGAFRFSLLLFLRPRGASSVLGRVTLISAGTGSDRKMITTDWDQLLPPAGKGEKKKKQSSQ